MDFGKHSKAFRAGLAEICRRTKIDGAAEDLWLEMTAARSLVLMMVKDGELRAFMACRPRETMAREIVCDTWAAWFGKITKQEKAEIFKRLDEVAISIGARYIDFMADEKRTRNPDAYLRNLQGLGFARRTTQHIFRKEIKKWAVE